MPLDKSSFSIEDTRSEKVEPALFNPVETAIKIAINYKASDVHVKSNRQTRVRVKTELKKTDVVATANDLYEFCKKYKILRIRRSFPLTQPLLYISVV